MRGATPFESYLIGLVIGCAFGVLVALHFLHPQENCEKVSDDLSFCRDLPKGEVIYRKPREMSI